MAAKSFPTTPTSNPAVGQDRSAPRELAPWPQIDRYPTVIGQGLSLQYVGSVFRTALVGYRQQAVDLLSELIEKDGHAFSVAHKRVLAVAGGKLELVPVELPATASQAETTMAQEVCDFCSVRVRAIPNLVQHIAALMWSTYFGVTACESHWDKIEGEWQVTRLSNVHSRRLAYPDQFAWDLYVWDQGNVLLPYGMSPTNGIYGLRVADYPGKFIVHTPELRGEYPTRDGVGRILATWIVLKLIATRGGSQYLERFAKPWPEATYRTTDDDQPRAANDEDKDAATAALNALGNGSLSSWVHPDSVKLDLRTPDTGSTGKLSFAEWIGVCNAEESKATVGSTLTTEVGSTGGNRALGQVHEQGEMRIAQYDADGIAETLKRDLVAWLVRLNFPPAAMKYVPQVKIHVGPEPDPDAIVDRAARGAAAGMPVDADKVAQQAGVPLVAPDDENARRMLPLSPVDILAINPELGAQATEIAKARMDAMPPPEPMPAPGKPRPKNEGPQA